MRVAIVTESFLPQVNGVTNTVRHVVRHLVRSGHEPLVIAPGPGGADHDGVPVHRARSVRLPRYSSFPVGLPDVEVRRVLADFRPDVVHLASPIALGAVGLRAARRLDLPTVAVYQTDVGGFARHYGVPADALLDRWVARVHRRADRTLVPSEAARAQLSRLGRARPPPVAPRRLASTSSVPTGATPTLHAAWSGGRAAGRRRLRRPAGRGEAGAPPRRARRPPRGAARRGRRRPRAGAARAAPARCRLHRLPPGRRAGHRLRLAGRLRPPRRERDLLPDRAGGAGQRRRRRRAQPGRPGRPRRDRPLGAALRRRRPRARCAGPWRRWPPSRWPGRGSRWAGGSAVAGRTWGRLVAELVQVHYAAVIEARAARASARRPPRPYPRAA